MSQSSSRSSMVAILLLGFMGGVQTVDPSIANIVFARASAALNFSVRASTLAASISTLMLAATVIATGLLADIMGRRKLLMIALLCSIAGDLLVFFSPTPTVFILGRALAGVGLGGVFSGAYGYVKYLVPKDQLGSSLGIFTAVGAVIAIVAILMGGAMANWHWRDAFLVVPICSAIALMFTPKCLPVIEANPAQSIDYAGLLVLGLAMICLLMGVSNATRSMTSFVTIGLTLLGFLLFTAFVLIEKKISHPVFPISLFQSTPFNLAAIAGTVGNFSLGVLLLQVSNFWQYVNHFSTGIVALAQMPYVVISIIMSIVIGKLINRGIKEVDMLIIGYLLSGAGFLSLALIKVEVGYLMSLPALVLIGAGYSALLIASSNLFIAEAPEKFYGAVISSKTTFGQFGYTLGLALSTVVITKMMDAKTAATLVWQGNTSADVSQGLQALGEYVRTGVKPESTIGLDAFRAALPAYIDSYVLTMMASGALMFIFMFHCLAMRKKALSKN